MIKKIVLSLAVAGVVAAAMPSAFAASTAAQIANGTVSQNEAVAIGAWPNTANK